MISHTQFIICGIKTNAPLLKNRKKIHYTKKGYSYDLDTSLYSAFKYMCECVCIHPRVYTHKHISRNSSTVKK